MAHYDAGSPRGGPGGGGAGGGARQRKTTSSAKSSSGGGGAVRAGKFLLLFVTLVTNGHWGCQVNLS